MPDHRIVDYHQMIENAPMVFMRLNYKDMNWITWFVTKNIDRYGYDREDFMNGKLSWYDIVHPDDRVLMLKLSQDYVALGVDNFKLQYRVLTPKGESLWVTEFSHLNRDDNGDPTCWDSVLLDSAFVKLGQALIEDNARRQIILNDILLSLHDAENENALQIILDRTGAYLNTSRALLFKDSPDHVTCKVVYEWLNTGITSIKDLDYAVTYSTEMPEIYVALQETGALLVNAGEIPENGKEEFESEGLVSSAIFAVYLHGDHYGFVCFDDCVIERTWDEETASFLKIIAGLISTVLMRLYTEEQLRISQRTCETVLDNVDSYIFAVHPETNAIIFANRAFRTIFGSNVIGRNSDAYLKLEPFGDKEDKQDKPNDAPSPRHVTYETYLEKTGQWLAATKEQVFWIDGQTVYLVNAYDITHKKRYEENIKRLAYLDYLTDLPNRYRCNIDLARSIESAARAKRPGYLLFIDLDDFKVVNDCYGHDYGDGVLISFARFLQTLFVGDNHVFRFGGDEFVIVINHSNGDKLQSYLNAMLERAKSPWKSLDKAFYCSLSIGIVEFIDASETVQTLLKRADIAMYQAKKLGKNNYVFYSEDLGVHALRRTEMENLLRRAIENDFQGFEILYQPYVDAGTRKVVGAEALTRMRDNNGNLLLPEQFIGLAEYLGFIVPIGEYVLKKAAEECKRFNNLGLPDFTITVNLSAKQFKQKGIVPKLESILRETGVSFSNLVISINEKVALVELERMLLLSDQLRQQGIQVALDDFGSGSASFINMRNLPVDIIKVSSRYIDAIEDEFTGYFIKLVTDLAHFTNKRVCMNGVETDEQLAFCARMNVDLVQGFLLHRPLTRDELSAMLNCSI